MIYRIILLLCTIFTSHALLAQDREFSKDQLREDLTFLRNKIMEYNPALGKFHDIEEFNSAYDSLARLIDRPMTDLDFFPLITKLAATTREGHTYVGQATDTVSNIYKGFFNGAFEYMPLAIDWSGDTVFVYYDLSEEGELTRGDRLVSINEQPIEQVTDKLMEFVIADGNIISARRRAVEELFSAYYFWFVDRPEVFDIEYISKRDNKKHSVAIRATTRDSMLAVRERRYGPRENSEFTIDDIYEFTLDSNVAQLTLKTFNNARKEQFDIDTEDLYEKIFRELKSNNIEFLIIDVRDNSGGRKEYVRDLLPYLMKKDTSGIFYYSYSWKGKKKKYKLPNKSDLAFDGKVIVLTNASSFSSASSIALMAKEYADATIIGEETATRYEGFAAGSAQFITLPNTKIPVKIPRYYYDYRTLKQDTRNRGVIPHIRVTYSLSDHLNERDAIMEAAREFIRSRR